jgi:uncharacterized SAM-dependent methyltransferase
MGNIKDEIFNELVKNGYSKSGDNKTWDISQRRFLYATPDLAKSFLNLKKLERYNTNILGRELELIKNNASKFFKEVGNSQHFNLIDLGCGDGNKAKLFVGYLRKDLKMRYCAVNVSDYLVNLALNNVIAADFENVIDYKKHIADFDDLEKVSNSLRSKDYPRNVILLLGSILASYEINDYLFKLSNSMKKGDYLVIGNSMRVEKKLSNLKSYKSKYFEKWFSHIIKELGLKPDEVRYDARFGNARVEMFYKLKKDKTLKHKGMLVDFKKGDEILIAKLFKYYESELNKFCKMYFSKVEISKHPDGYALIVCER